MRSHRLPWWKNCELLGHSQPQIKQESAWLCLYCGQDVVSAANKFDEKHGRPSMNEQFQWAHQQQRQQQYYCKTDVWTDPFGNRYK